MTSLHRHFEAIIEVKMATAESEDSFEIHPDVVAVLEELRTNRLQWVADEVEHRIREGAIEQASFEAPRSKRSKRFEAIRGLTLDEQIAVLLRAIRNYLLLPSKIWRTATTEIIATINSRSVASLQSIELAPPGIEVTNIDVTNDDAEIATKRAMSDLEPFFKASKIQNG